MGQSVGFEGCISRAIWFDVLLRDAIRIENFFFEIAIVRFELAHPILRILLEAICIRFAVWSFVTVLGSSGVLDFTPKLLKPWKICPTV